jgi:phosphoribosyl-dephospho-CoA transferase
LRLNTLLRNGRRAPTFWKNAPLVWRFALDHVAALCAEFDIELRAFGRSALQCLTRLDYLTPASDIDLLFLNARRFAVAPLVGALAEIDAKAPSRLDGEVVRADGAAGELARFASARRASV